MVRSVAESPRAEYRQYSGSDVKLFSGKEYSGGIVERNQLYAVDCARLVTTVDQRRAVKKVLKVTKPFQTFCHLARIACTGFDLHGKRPALIFANTINLQPGTVSIKVKLRSFCAVKGCRKTLCGM